MPRDVHALHGDPAAIWGLIGLGFAYGVSHAAGPGHGKAVIASYMMASDRALRRGVVLALLAALLQGAVAVALVGVAALVFNATAARMNAVADWLALASYLGVAAIGVWLVVEKGPCALRGAAGALSRAARRWRPRRSSPARRGGRRRLCAAGAFRAGPDGAAEAAADDRPPAATPMRPTRARWARAFPGAAPLATVVAAGARPARARC